MLFDNLSDLNLDPTVSPRKHRLLKFAAVPLAIAFVALMVLWLRTIDVFPDSVRVTNDMGGSLVCYQRYKTNGHDYVQDVGRIAAGESANIQEQSSCATFDAAGRYVACLIVPRDGKQALASAADRSVSAETCVYPR
jgi:hypothetical protein